MPSSYHITEPHPSVPSSHYIVSGRGGAGNIAHVDPKSLTSGPDAAGPASRTALGHGTAGNATASAHPYYSSGRGGAGNQHHYERPIFSFDEELERQRRMMEHQAPVYHVGRGGAGNAYGSGSSAPSGARRSSAGGSTASSVGSHSVRDGLGETWARLRGSLSK